MAKQVKHFTDLEVWRRSHELFLALVRDVDPMPQKRGVVILTDQTLRSVGSIGANIAEGFNRSKKKYLNCLDISFGESNEAENWLYKFRDAGFLEKDVANARVRECIEIEKMLSGLMRSIRQSPNT
jgi:four helix bundle protein